MADDEPFEDGDGDGWDDDGNDGGGWDDDNNDQQNNNDDFNNNMDVDDAIQQMDNEANDQESWQIEVENLYYTAESDRKNDPKGSLKNFLECIRLEEEKGGNVVDKRFGALKHVVIILYQLSADDEKNRKLMIEQYKKLLSYADIVSPNDLNNAIRSILNIIQEKEGKNQINQINQNKNNNNNNNNNNNQTDNILTIMYSMTLQYFKSKPNKERVWFEFAMRLCKTYLTIKDYKRCELLLDELHNSCKLKSNGEDDPEKGAQLLEIYSIKIQIVTAANDRVALSELFERTNQLFADVNDPRSMSVIKECWGKMYASMNQWNEAYSNFFDAFRSYQDIGHSNVKSCLKYVVMASMLSDTDTNPFATQEAGVFQNNPDIMPIANLLDSFETDDIVRFESLLVKDKAFILSDEFMVEFMPSVTLRLRSRVLVKLIKPYKRVKLEWLCKQLNCNKNEIENLVVNLILDGSINGRLDQIHSLLDLNYMTPTDQLYSSMDQWLKMITRLQQSISNRTTRHDYGGGGGGGHGMFGGGGGGRMMMNMDYLMDIDDDFMGYGNENFVAWM